MARQHPPVVDPEAEASAFLAALHPQLEEFACPRCQTAARCTSRGISDDRRRRLWQCDCGFGFGTPIGGLR